MFFDKKVGDFIKNEIWKPYRRGLRDSERLFYEEGGKYSETTADDYASVFGTYALYEQVKWDETMQQVGPSFQYEVVKSKWDKL